MTTSRLAEVKTPMHSQVTFSSRPARGYLLVKSTVDRLAAGVLIMMISPLFAAIALTVAIKLGRPVFFTQRRAGLHGQPFTLYKFRTMTDARGPDGKLLPDAVRLTPLGATLRRLSLDELPQLINVLKGDMSFIGPRPLLVQYLERYSERHARRHEVKPGITGWAQVNGRQSALFSQRLEMDVWYVEHVSAAVDLQILLRTIPRVLSSSGVQNGQTVEEVDDLGLYRDE